MAYSTAFSSDQETEEAQFFWVMILWAFSKNLFYNEKEQQLNLDFAKKLDLRLKESALAFIELTVCLVIMTSQLNDHYGWIVCFLVLVLFIILNLFWEYLSLTAFIFPVLYGF